MSAAMKVMTSSRDMIWTTPQQWFDYLNRQPQKGFFAVDAWVEGELVGCNSGLI